MAKGIPRKEFDRIRVNSGQQFRIYAVMALLGIVAFIPVIAQLGQLMITDYSYYSDLALRNQTRTTTVTAHRGTIYDRNMNIMAFSTTVENVYLDPHELKQSKADLNLIAEKLSQLLKVDKERILKLSQDLTKRYQLVAANAEEEVAAQVREFINSNNISGVHLEPSSKRNYPYGTLASQVLGFTNASNSGSEGIEVSYNSYLEGIAGKVITTKGSNEMDMPYSYEKYVQAIPGCDVILTLDTTVQACLEKQMQAAIDQYDVQNGAFGMVMEVKTGKILAMATIGGYDPNNYLEIYDEEASKEIEQLRLNYLAQPSGSQEYENAKSIYDAALSAARLKQWRNRVLSDAYEPGSTFKVLTMAAALDCGAIDLNTRFHCSGSEKIPGRSQLLHCWRSQGHGAEDTAQALQNSCNLAFAHIALKLGGERFYDYINRFGVMEKTGVDLAGESKGVFFSKELVVNTEKWGTASLTSGSFGQTFKLTPIQLVRAISAVVNGGTLMEPYIVSEVLDSNGTTILQQEPTAVRQVISQETSATMCQLLKSVVDVGTAKNASVAGFSIGGKTGTSEKIDVLDENGQPTLDKIVSFVGIAPMDDPQYIVLVALDTPSRETGIYISGGVMAAPTVGAVMGDILPYLGVQQTFTENDTAGKNVVIGDYSGLTFKETEKLLKQNNITAKYIGTGDTVTGQIPRPGETVSGGSQILIYLGENAPERMVEVPDFAGMTRQQANDAAGALGLYILPSGNLEVSKAVTVTKQEIPAKTQVPVGTSIRLEFADTKAPV